MQRPPDSGQPEAADPAAPVLETERLVLRQLTLEDAPFMLQLVNEPSWLRFIGDRGVRTLEDARRYLQEGPLASYARHGFGLYLTELKPSGAPAGICGLIKRDSLEDVDLGFAFLPRYWGRGYATEAAAAVVGLAFSALGLERLVAITTLDNASSIKLLEKLGMRREESVELPGEGAPLLLFACSAT
jgi:RimJ/RimL family protein N-acetyltransferase